MRAGFEPEHEALRESVRAFAARDASDDVRATFARAAEHGFVSMGAHEEHGGAGLDDLRFNAVVAEELMLAGRGTLGLLFAVHNDVCVPALGAAARVDQLAVLAARGEDGRLDRVAGGMHADVVVVAEDGEACAYAVEDVERSASEDGFGLQGAGFADIELSDAQATDLGTFDWRSALARSHAVLALAGARFALTTTLGYVADRRAFGVPIASFGNTRHALAGLSAEIEAAQPFVDACLDTGVGPAQVAAAKLVATGIHGRAVDLGVQLHGGYGYMLEYPISTAYVDARFLRLHGGGEVPVRETLAASLGL